tara:strand:+ start:2015 stop:3676 length:1662 start_codon:yes stop_codon:yes gene_type:complete
MSNYVNDALLGASPYKKQKEESKALVSKWDKTGLLDGLNEDFQRSGMAIMLENQAKQLVSEAGVSTTNPTGGSDEEWSGVALPLVRRIFGEIAAQEFVSVQPMNLPSGLVFYLDFKYGSANSGVNQGGSLGGTTGALTPAADRDAHGEGGLYGAGTFGYSISQSKATITGIGMLTQASSSFSHWNNNTELSASKAATQTLVSGSEHYVQISLPTGGDASGEFAKADFKAVRNFRIAGTYIDSYLPELTNYDSANEVVNFIVAPKAGGALDDGTYGFVSSSVTVDFSLAPQEADRGDFESKSGAGMAIPEVDLQLNSSAIVAKTRKLKAVWTPELAQDLNAYHSVDAEAELTSMLSEYISMEIDLEILDMLIADATTVDFWSVKQGDDFDASTNTFKPNTFTGTRFEWFQTLVQKIQKVSNEIHRLTLRGGANFCVVSPKIATILESLPGYNSNATKDANKFAMGVSQIGSVDSRFTVYKNPYMTENQILVGFRGSNFLETGAVYAPYVPLIMTPLVYDPTDFTPRKGVMTRYAKKMIRPEFYGKIQVSGLELL